MANAEIVSTGLYAPEKLVKNEYFNELYQKDIDTFLREKRNIYQRYFMSEEQATSDLIVPAANQALKRAGLQAKDLDLILVATDTPDYLSPSTASVVQYKLQATDVGCFDINSACAGFATALDVAWKYIKADENYQNVLVVGAYGMSKYLNWDDYKIASLFADGAGAVVLKRTEDESSTGLLSSYLWADGQYHDYMGVYGGGTCMPVNQDVMERKDHLLNFAKKIPNEFNPTHWPRTVRRLLKNTGYELNDVDHFFFTQINIQGIIESMARLEVPMDKTHNIMDRYGYTGSACLPMALDDAASQQKLKKGDLLVLVGSGGGVSLGGIILKWGYDT